MQKEGITNNRGINAQDIANQTNKSVKSRHSDYTVEYRNSIVEVWNSGTYTTVAECAKNYDKKKILWIALR